MSSGNNQMIRKFRVILSESDIDEALISDELLLWFLHYRNKDVDRVLKAVKSWITFKKNHPELTSNLQTICPQPHTSSIIHRVFPVRDQHGRRVYIAQIGLWRDDTFGMMFFVYWFMICKWSLLILRPKKRGAIGVLDCRNFGFKKMKSLTPSYLKSVANILQGSFPVKI